MSTEASNWDSFVAWLFPPACPACLGRGEPVTGFCPACLGELPTLGRRCAVCAVRLPGTRDESTASDAVCGHCLAQAPAFDRTFAAFPYESPISDLVRNLKFRRRLHCARPLGTLFAARVAQERGASRPDCFVPIPLHPTRLRRRGFNQSLEIARELARRFNAPLDARCLERIGASVPQTALPARQRLRNPKGTFVVRHAPRGRCIVIVDDVMTTGATVNEAARVLRRAGAERIEAWVAARS